MTKDATAELIAWLCGEAMEYDPENVEWQSPVAAKLRNAATALEALQAENERLRVQLQEMILMRDEALDNHSATQRSLLARMVGIKDTAP